MYISISLALHALYRLLLKYLSVVTVRESAAECLHEIVSKGMF